MEQTTKLYHLPNLSKSKQNSQKVHTLTHDRSIPDNLKINLRNENNRKNYSKIKHDAYNQSINSSIKEKFELKSENKRQNSEKYHESQFYTEIREWLNHVYGNKRNSKIKQFYNSIHRKTVPMKDLSPQQSFRE